MSTVFLSYRRIDSQTWCKRLSDHLSLRFGDDMVFRDVDDLKAGMQWQREIDAALRGTRLVLVLIGPKWLAKSQRQRLADPRDVLRREITLALQSPRRKVVPVLLGGASMPKPTLLPRPLRALCDWQAVSLRDRQWRPDVERLVERLHELMPARRSDGSALEQVHHRLQQEQSRYFELLDQHPQQALTLARATLKTLNRVCPLHPQDSDLQLVRGYTHKNVAMALQRRGQWEGAEQALEEAWRTFSTATRERPADAGAWNGMGSVCVVRGQLKQSLRYIERALRLHPGYPAALQDKAAVLAALANRGAQTAPSRSSRLSTLPTAERGSSGRNSTTRGRL
jgi:tetratricopeptide (TPR) repeat protein